jgi:hypothetical protein
VVAALVRVERRSRSLEQRRRGGHAEDRRLEQSQRVNQLRPVEGELQRHRATARVAGDVRASDIEVLQQRGGVRRMVRDAHRRSGVRASPPPALVVSNEAVPIDQRRFGQEWHECSRHHGTDQQQRFARALLLVLDLDPLDLCAFHDSPRVCLLHVATWRCTVGSPVTCRAATPSHHGVRMTVTAETFGVTDSAGRRTDVGGAQAPGAGR